VVRKKLSPSSFQIRAIDAVPCALWAFVKYYNDPEESIIRCVGLGGDTDTIASMTGALCGALHGTCWIPIRWFDNLENEEHGRDWTVKTGIALSALDLHTILPYDESVHSEPVAFPRD